MSKEYFRKAKRSELERLQTLGTAKTRKRVMTELKRRKEMQKPSVKQLKKYYKDVEVKTNNPLLRSLIKR